MVRKSIDCGQIFGDGKCTLAISGTEEEVLDLVILHAIVSHSCNDPYELRTRIRGLLIEVPASHLASA